MACFLSFKTFLNENTSDRVVLFHDVFKIEIEMLEESVSSSKQIYSHFTLDSPYKRKLYKDVFLDFYKTRLLEN